MTMPSTISSTIVGSRTRGKNPTLEGRSPSRSVNVGRRFQWPGVALLVCAARWVFLVSFMLTSV